MPSIGELSAWILVDGERLPEYQLEEDRSNVANTIIKCHIRSETGKAFQIGFSFNGARGPDVRLTASVELDGYLLKQIWGLHVFSQERIIEGLVQLDSIEPFNFANLNVTESHDNDSSSERIGLIKVKVDWRRYVGPAIPPAAERTVLHDPQPVNERKKKMTTHRVILGDRVPRGPSMWTRYEPVRSLPTYEFHFQYANEALLSARGIMPNIPALVRPKGSPGPSSRKRPPSTKLSRETEVQDLTLDEDDLFPPVPRKRKKARLETTRVDRVKTEAGRYLEVQDLTLDEDDLCPPEPMKKKARKEMTELGRVKTEAKSRHLIDSSEVIDLTEDD